MENLYDDLENYEDEKIIEDLKNENSELKKKLEQYSSTINQLQIDFDNLSSEYKKLELNYSSLLKTARAEIERKTNMITQLNVEKDMMVIQAFQNKGKQSFKNVTCNKDTKSKNTDYESSHRPKNEDIPCKSVEKPTSGHLCAIDSKENLLDSKQKATSKNIITHKKSMPVLGRFKKKCDDEPIHLLKEERLRDDEILDKKSRIKNSNYEDKYSYYNASASTKSDKERYRNYNYRQRDKSRHRRKSPKRISRHRSRSPPADRFSRHKSRDRRNNYNDSEPSANREIISGNQVEHVLKHKLLPHSEEPNYKKIRVDSYGTYPCSEKSCGDGELLSFSPAVISPEDPLRSCQSPDYLNYDIDQSLIKEIVHTAITPQDDPRITSKKYIVQAENGKEVLKSISSNEVCLQRIDPLHWGIPKVIIPDALLQKPSLQSSQDNPQSYSDTNHIGLCISFNPIQDNCNVSNSNVNSNECITEKSSVTSEIPNVYSSHIKKHQHYSTLTHNAEFQSLLMNSYNPTLRSQAKTSKNCIPFINDTEPVHEQCDLVSIGTIEGDLLLSDEASDNADKATTSDQTTIIKIKHTKASKSKLSNTSPTNSSGNKVKKRDDLTEKIEEFDNKNKSLQSIEKGCNREKKDDSYKESIYENKDEIIECREMCDVRVEQGNYFENLTKIKCGKDTVILPKDTDKDIKSTIDSSSKNAAISLESIKAEVNLLNEKEISKFEICKNETCNVELEQQVPDKNKSVNNVNVKVEIPSKIRNKQHSEVSTNMSTKHEKPKKHQERSSDKQSKENIINKKHKKKKSSETKDNTKIEDNTVTTDSKRKFSDLFGESSNSLIMPEDLGIKSREAVESLTTKFVSICDDTQSAVDLNIDNVESDSKNHDPSRMKENVADTRISIVAGDNLTNGTVICRDTHSPKNSNLFENIKPAISMDSPDVVIISTGVQSKLAEDSNGESKGVLTVHPLTALATSTPLKEEKSVPVSQSVKEAVQDEPNVGDDVPDVRIFVKRRRKIKKP